MSIIKQSIIREIAVEIARGNVCFINRYSSKVTTIDNSIVDEEKIASQDKLRKELDLKVESHLRIEKPSVADQLIMMEYFIGDLQDKSLRKQLTNALNRKNPIRNFIQTVENNFELNLHWGTFSTEEYERWVANFIIDAYNY